MSHESPRERNILIISDLHLGEDLRPVSNSVSYLRHLAKLERELGNFIDHYTHHRVDGRPWSLVVNGDMVDFMSVMILPEPAEPGSPDHDEEDRLYGLGYGERQSQKKLEQVIARHKSVFGKLATFVAAGNELVIVIGNHDVEFHYPSVQRTLMEWLCGLAIGAGVEESGKAEFAARIQFCPWFYYRPDLIYVEHGHQYDEYCSFDYLLHPVSPHKSGRGGKKSGIAISLAHTGMRYFANRLPQYDPRTAEHWSVLNYMRWGWAQGLRGAISVSYLYGLLVWRVVEAWYSLREADGERRAVHQERLRGLSTHWHLTEEKLVALDALRRLPVTKRLYKLLSALFVDRVLLGVLALAGAAALAIELHGWWRLGGALGAVFGAALTNQFLNHFRLTTSASRLRQAPELIRQLVSAPFIVFGHSHAPETVALDGGGVYFNTGTWASDDADNAFTHVLITHTEETGVPHAELRQWRDGSSAPYRWRQQ